MLDDNNINDAQKLFPGGQLVIQLPLCYMIEELHIPSYTSAISY